ncbi:MAG TPA: hypothetical protein VH325_14740 [Bryobacteraceae bacterium]|jgi:hypothetical protein|nr:hypothetical protein [Bryobacteraceae bacterium]
MPELEEPREPDTPETAWKSQTEEQERSMQIAFTPEELCTMARSREKLNARVTRAIVAVTLAFTGVLLYNIHRLDQPWIRAGQAWMLGVIVYLFLPALERRVQLRGAGEPCARFLERQHEERRCGYLWIRRRLFLFIPSMVASWLGGGPMAATWARGLDLSSWLFHFLDGLWPFLIAGAALVLVWFAFGKAAEKAAQDREEVHRGIGALE